MASYTMYLDESETHHNGRYYFAIGGLIIKNEDYDNIEQSLNAINRSFGVEIKMQPIMYFMKWMLVLHISD